MAHYFTNYSTVDRKMMYHISKTAIWYIILRSTVLYFVKHFCGTILYFFLRYGTVRKCCTMKYHIVTHRTEKWSKCMVNYCTSLYFTFLEYHTAKKIQYGTIWYHTMHYFVVQYCTMKLNYSEKFSKKVRFSSMNNNN